MKFQARFSVKLMAIMLAVCLALAGAGAWLTGLNFWILFLVLVLGVLANGVIALIEDRKSSRTDD